MQRRQPHPHPHPHLHPHPHPHPHQHLWVRRQRARMLVIRRDAHDDMVGQGLYPLWHRYLGGVAVAQLAVVAVAPGEDRASARQRDRMAPPARDLRARVST